MNDDDPSLFPQLQAEPLLLAGIALYHTPDMRLLAANPPFLAMLDRFIDPSWQQGRVIGHCLREWGLPAQVGVLHAMMQHVVQTGQREQREVLAFVTLQGETTYWNWTVDALRDVDGQMTYLFHIVSEVKPQEYERLQGERAQQTMEPSLNWLEAFSPLSQAHTMQMAFALKHIATVIVTMIRDCFHPIGVCLHSADAPQQVFRLQYFHTPPGSEQALQTMQTVPYTSPSFIARAACNQEPLCIQDLQKVAASGGIDPGNPLVKGGIRGYISMPLWFQNTCYGAVTAIFAEPISCDDPLIQALLMSGTPIASALACVHMHAPLQYAREYVRALFDQLPVGMLLVDHATDSLLYANPRAATLLGMPQEHLFGCPLAQFPSTKRFEQTGNKNDLLPSWQTAALRAFEGEVVSSQEMLVIRPDTTTMTVLTSSAPLWQEGNEMTGAAVIFQDITAKKQVEQEKDLFLSMVQHELRTPATIIQGFADLLLAHDGDATSRGSFRERALTNISLQSEQLVRMIEELLDFSRLHQHPFTLHCEPCDVLALLKQAIDGVGVSTEPRIHLRVEGLEASDTLIGSFDKRRVLQVVQNLVGNAIKYSPAEGKIEVGLRYRSEDSPSVLLWVKDQGMGIAEEDLAHIFTPFYRADMPDASPQGFGLGLAFVKEIVTRHHGRVWAESIPGQGSTFYVSLPC